MPNAGTTEQPLPDGNGPGRSALLRLLAVVALGGGLAALPHPAGVTLAGWRVLSVLVATVLGFVLRPLPMGPLVMLSLIMLSATKTLSFKESMAGFGNTTVWLVVAAFIIAGAVRRTGFGRRIALTLVVWLGRSSLGLGYALAASELLLGPAVPSNTARGGGIMAPIVDALARAVAGGGAAPASAGSDGRGTMGAYLALTGAHVNLVTAAMFLTGMAANPLVAQAAHDVLAIELTWTRWAVGAIAPGLVSLALIPALLHRIVRPDTTGVALARGRAREELERLGPWTPRQLGMGGVFVLLLLLWTTKSWHGLGTGLVAWIGVVTLVVMRIDDWKSVTGDAATWDALVWLGGLLSIAEALKAKGVVAWLAVSAQAYVADLSGTAVALTLGVIYFFSMYGFSMLTGHIVALVAAFFGVAMAAGAPPLMTALLFAYLSNLCGALTNYSTGPVVIYFGLGYVDVARWLRVGFVVGLCHLVVWVGGGLLWWRLLGWW